MEDMKIYNALVAAKLAGTSGGGGGNIASNNVTAMTGYEEAETASAIETTDSLNQAVGKLEKSVDDNKNNISLLLPTAYTAPTIMSDATNNLQIIDGGYFKQGNTVFVNMRILVTDDILTNRWLFNDFPAPVTTLTSGSTCGLITAMSSSPDVSDTILALMAYNPTQPTGGTPNQAAIYTPGNHSGLLAGTYLLSGTYLAVQS